MSDDRAEVSSSLWKDLKNLRGEFLIISLKKIITLLRGLVGKIFFEDFRADLVNNNSENWFGKLKF